MNRLSHRLNLKPLSFSIALLGAVTLHAGSPAPAKAKAPPPAAPAVRKEIPKSVFAIPATAREGRNPFFPHSTLGQDVVQHKSPAANISNLVLNGISSPPHKMVMINGHTFEEGETAEVKLPSGAKIQVQCLKILAEGALIQVGPQLRELRLRSGP